MSHYVLESDRDQICSQLNDIENWLYEDGEDCDRDVYVKKLTSLKERTDPIRERAQDFENCPQAFADLKQAIHHGRSAYNEFKKGATKYDHLTEAEFLNVCEATDKAQHWLDSRLSSFSTASHTDSSPVKLSEIEHETQAVNSAVNSVITRPKPNPTNSSNNTKGGGSSERGGTVPSTDSEQQQNGGDSTHPNNQHYTQPKAAGENMMDVE